MSAALNVFFVDEHTGAPVIGIVVGISGDDRPLATLQSGVAGYVSLKLDRAKLSKVSRIIVSHGDAQLLAVDVADVVTGKDTYTVRVDPASAKLSPLGGRAPGTPEQAPW